MIPMENELWRQVVGWPAYEVSTMGGVRSARGPIKQFTIYGYMSFNVCDGRYKRKSLRTHREVLRAFCGDRPDLFACHIDGNPTNNRLSNLRWGSAKDNEADKIRHGRSLRGSRHHQSKLSEKQAREILESSEPLGVLADRYGVTKTNVCAIRRGRSWRHLCSG